MVAVVVDTVIIVLELLVEEEFFYLRTIQTLGG